MQYWPFLVAASYRSDYRTVLCPDVVERAGLKAGLRTRLDFSATHDGATRFCDVDDDKLGPASLFYQVSRIQDAGKDAYDDASRPLVRANGILVKNGKDEQLDEAEAERLIGSVLPEIDTAFRRFWSAQQSFQSIISVARTRPARPNLVSEKPEDRREPFPPPPPPKPDPNLAQLVRQRKLLSFAFAGSLVVNALLLPAQVHQSGRGDLQAALDKSSAELAALSTERDKLGTRGTLAEKKIDELQTAMKQKDGELAAWNEKLRNQEAVAAKKINELQMAMKQKDGELTVLSAEKAELKKALETAGKEN